LRPQRAVIQALGVRVFEGLRDVAHELKALGDERAKIAKQMRERARRGMPAYAE
jgi:hypothetical protein